jgi:hypothetical protein
MMEQSDSEEEWTMCVQTAEPYVEPPNDVEMEMATSQLKNGKATSHDKIPTTLIKEENSRMYFMNSFQAYGRKRPYHMIGNMA